MALGLSLYHSDHQRVLCLAQVSADLSSQHSPSQVPPNLAQVATNQRAYFSSYQVAPSLAKVEANLDLYLSTPLQGDPFPTYPMASFRPHQRPTKPASQLTYLKGGPNWHQRQAELTPAQKGKLTYNSSSTVVMASPYSQST